MLGISGTIHHMIVKVFIFRVVRGVKEQETVQNDKKFCSLHSIFNLQNSGAKYVINEMLRQFQNFPVCLGNTSAKNIAKDSGETFSYYIGNGFSMPQHFAKGYDLFF